MNPASPAAIDTARLVLVEELLFDMDGTLVNSIEAVEQMWRDWAVEHGVDLPDIHAFHGRTARDLVASMVPADQVERAAARLNEIESSWAHPIPTIAGAPELIASLPRDRWAVVTSAAAPVAASRLAAAGLPTPEHLVTGSDVANGKPHPEPFQRGRRRDGAAIAFEDTVAGLRSARGAGCVTVGVMGTTSAEELREHADYVVHSLEAVTVAEVGESGIRLSIVSL